MDQIHSIMGSLQFQIRRSSRFSQDARIEISRSPIRQRWRLDAKYNGSGFIEQTLRGWHRGRPPAQPPPRTLLPKEKHDMLKNSQPTTVSTLFASTTPSNTSIEPVNNDNALTLAPFSNKNKRRLPTSLFRPFHPRTCRLSLHATITGFVAEIRTKTTKTRPHSTLIERTKFCSASPPCQPTFLPKKLPVTLTIYTLQKTFSQH
jgi:hypothetical protein